MKKIYLVLTLGTIFIPFSNTSAKTVSRSYHPLTITNHSAYDISLCELTHGDVIQTHNIPPHSTKEFKFSKTTDSVEANVKFGNVTYHNNLPINPSCKTLTITKANTLYLRAQ